MQRTVVALVATGDGRWPAQVRAAETMLQARVGAVIGVPYDPQIRSTGMAQPGRLKPRTLAAASELVRAVLAAAHATWGEPLPPAAVPAAAHVL
ncbi:hypothetical protein [Streptomyces mashuensis]|uniref:hypothetical protein n=1 Tax=Streptomyces mashuensis TaxID=33904 RepID=UPI001E477DED|nr:hypothetical protein [Streptomyces mashuensis]